MNQNIQTGGASLRFAFIQARWHACIVDQARIGFLDEIARQTGGGTVTDVFDAPGAFEIPLLAQRLARSGLYDGIVGAAFVVDGGIYRHEFVAEAVVSGLMRVQLETDAPIFSVVLTPHQFQDTAAHTTFFKEHFVRKGEEAASAALAVAAMTNASSKAA
ncbi:6,7-dimethyl-8-ribityllumazine synthase [Pikeienuella sp. HZG-20]|uniref:6,7-dimethyl-8-ribityllumazine synthase n=1 Tax=Paludibacillus litoralis TaxID=3133267 RepID=UPI0030EF2EBF